jgi:hypothetical protein
MATSAGAVTYHYVGSTFETAHGNSSAAQCANAEGHECRPLHTKAMRVTAQLVLSEALAPNMEYALVGDYNPSTNRWDMNELLEDPWGSGPTRELSASFSVFDGAIDFYTPEGNLDFTTDADGNISTWDMHIWGRSSSDYEIVKSGSGGHFVGDSVGFHYEFGVKGCVPVYFGDCVGAESSHASTGNVGTWFKETSGASASSFASASSSSAISPVPLPASLSFLMAGLLALGVTGRVRRSTAA